jgi:hypothetical protein
MTTEGSGRAAPPSPAGDHEDHPYGSPGLVPVFMASVDAYWGPAPAFSECATPRPEWDEVPRTPEVRPQRFTPSKVLSRTRLQTHNKNKLLAYALHSY